MTRFPEVAARYAEALFELGTENGKAADYAGALSSAAQALFSDAEVAEYLKSPLTLPKEKEAAIGKALPGKGLPEDVERFLLLLARNGRLELLNDIVTAYRARQDDAAGLIRGVVRSAAAVSDNQKTEIEKIVSSKSGKKVALTFELDPSLIGGISVQVGSLRFDDAIASHLTKMKDDLTRSLH